MGLNGLITNGLITNGLIINELLIINCKMVSREKTSLLKKLLDLVALESMS